MGKTACPFCSSIVSIFLQFTGIFSHVLILTFYLRRLIPITSHIHYHARSAYCCRLLRRLFRRLYSAAYSVHSTNFTEHHWTAPDCTADCTSLGLHRRMRDLPTDAAYSAVYPAGLLRRLFRRLYSAAYSAVYHNFTVAKTSFSPPTAMPATPLHADLPTRSICACICFVSLFLLL
jgi:hypothetical protein